MMRLMGMLDSPFVRRVAISLELLGVPFAHESVSVFSTFQKFQGINPAACEKAAQYIYERNLRPAALQFEPWLVRVTGQLQAACAGLEMQVVNYPALFSTPRSQAVITTAIAWQFTQSMVAELVPATSHPALVALSARMENTLEFLKYPPAGPGVPAIAK